MGLFALGVLQNDVKDTSKNLYFIPTDGTTGETTSHLTKAASCQVIGYSHSTKVAKSGNQVAGYAALRQRGKQASREAAARKKFSSG